VGCLRPLDDIDSKTTTCPGRDKKSKFTKYIGEGVLNRIAMNAKDGRRKYLKLLKKAACVERLKETIMTKSNKRIHDLRRKNRVGRIGNGDTERCKRKKKW